MDHPLFLVAFSSVTICGAFRVFSPSRNGVASHFVRGGSRGVWRDTHNGVNVRGLIAIAKGKFHEWLTDDGLLTIQGWARDGLTNEQIAHNIGVSERSFTDWVGRFPSLSSALKKGKAPVDIEVENALLKRALGYEYDEVTEEIDRIPYGKPDENGELKYIEHVKTKTKHVTVLPDVTAQIFWLKNRKPKQWRDKVENTITMDTEDLTPLVELLRDE